MLHTHTPQKCVQLKKVEVWLFKESIKNMELINSLIQTRKRKGYLVLTDLQGCWKLCRLGEKTRLIASRVNVIHTESTCFIFNRPKNFHKRNRESWK